MSKIIPGEFNFHNPEQEETSPQINSSLGTWSEQDITLLSNNGRIDRTFFPAEFGNDIKIGHRFKITGINGEKLLAKAVKLETVNTEDGDGLKITFELIGD